MIPRRAGGHTLRWRAGACGLALGMALLASPAATRAATPPTLAPAEPRLPDPAPPPEPEPSHLPARFWVPLHPAMARLERAIGQGFGTSGRFEREEHGAELRYRMVRDPLELAASGDTLFVRARVTYWLAARGPSFAQLECGSEREPYVARIGCMVLVGWDDAWRLDSRVIPLPIVHERRCKPKPPGIDFTEIMTGKLDEHLSRPLAAAIGPALAEEVLLAPRVTAIWEALRDPVELGRGGERWLDYGIRRMLAGPLLVAGDSLRVDLAVEMRPRLVPSRPEPGPASPGEPRVRLFGDRLDIAFDCTLSLDSLARRIRARCDAAADGPPAAVQVTQVTLRGRGDRLAVSLAMQGRIAGTVHLIGQLAYDERTHALSVRGLDYSSETRTALRGHSQPVRRSLEAIREQVASALDLDLTGPLVAAASPIGRAINRTLTDRVSIAGGMNQRRPLGIAVTERAVVTRLAASGRTWLVVR